MASRGQRLSIEVGDVLDGRITIGRVVGSGGMGVVYAGRDATRGCDVAIKTLLPELVHDATSKARFLREATASRALAGEHVVRVFDVGETDDGLPYIVMEYLLGETLASLAKERRGMSTEELVPLVLHVCDALAAAHRLGIVHRDLKPENVFVVEGPDATPVAKVLDFGIAKVHNANIADTGITTTGTVLGTPWYMAPEQLDTTLPITPKTDVWALGATMYKALTLATPFAAESVFELSVKIYAHEPTPIATHRPELPSAIVDIVHGCLQKDPKRRLSLDELVARLSAIPLGERRIAAAPAPLPRARLATLTETVTLVRGTARPTDEAPPSSETLDTVATIETVPTAETRERQESLDTIRKNVFAAPPAPAALAATVPAEPLEAQALEAQAAPGATRRNALVGFLLMAAGMGLVLGFSMLRGGAASSFDDRATTTTTTATATVTAITTTASARTTAATTAAATETAAPPAAELAPALTEEEGATAPATDTAHVPDPTTALSASSPRRNAGRRVPPAPRPTSKTAATAAAPAPAPSGAALTYER